MNEFLQHWILTTTVANVTYSHWTAIAFGSYGNEETLTPK
jgi:hypothetical protein